MRYDQSRAPGPLACIVDDLTFAYDGHPVFRGLSASMTGPGIVGLIGENGSGKSTLLKTVAGILEPQGGTVTITGGLGGTDHGVRLHELPLSGRARLIGYVPQKGMQDQTSVVYDYVMLGRKPYFTWREREEDRRIVRELLEELEIADLAFRLTGELSGGERQKVVIARTLAQETSVLLLDEPTNNLDVRYQLELFEILSKKVRELGLLVITALHDLNIALRYCDSLILLKKGNLLASGPAREIITPEILADCFRIEAEILPAGGSMVVHPVKRV
jgi:iron complex transport system ATP-binding protein